MKKLLFFFSLSFTPTSQALAQGLPPELIHYGRPDQGSILTNEPKHRVHPDIGGGSFGRSKRTGTEWTGKQWADLTEEEKCDTNGNTICLYRKFGGKIVYEARWKNISSPKSVGNRCDSSCNRFGRLNSPLAG